MGFGATVTTGDDNRPLRPELAQWLVEARVEQELGKPARFALRFEDDICGDRPAVAGAPELRPNTMVAIVAAAGSRRVCLVRGRIVQTRSSNRLSGQGSWLELHGEDRRVEMDRLCVQASWTGLASDAATQILGAYGFDADVEPTTTAYTEQRNALSQRGTDLDFLEKIASENAMQLWLEYEVEAGPASGVEAIPVGETARLRVSPPAGGSVLPPAPPVLVADDGPVIRVNVRGDDCPNITAFDVEVDFERPNAARGSTVNAADGAVDDAGGENLQNPMDDGAPLVEIDGVERTICVASPGDPEEQRRRQQAAITEASWFVEASVSTTAHMLGGVLAPHQLVDVQGAGPELSGPYQVKEVTHVVNAADHFIDAKLRTNTLGEG